MPVSNRKVDWPEPGERAELESHLQTRRFEMRSVRCDVCGTKALLMAASQCPKCSHLFEVRDGFGKLVSLSYCSSCESYYPATVGSCKWCGTAPERTPRGPFPWGRIGIGALVAMLWGVWLIRDPHPTINRAKSASGSRAPNIAPLDTAVPVVTAPAPTSSVAEKTTPSVDASPPLEAARDTAVVMAAASPPPTTTEPDPVPIAQPAPPPTVARAPA